MQMGGNQKGYGTRSVRKHLRLIAAYFRFNLAAALEYRGSFWMQICGMALNNAAFIVFWSVIYTKVHRIGNYSFRDIMFLWALTSAAFGFIHILFGNVRQMARMVMQGELDTYLLQPKDVCINLLASRSVVPAWGDLAYGLILYLMVYGFEPFHLLLFCGFTVLSGLLIGSVFLATQSLTFFIGDATAIGRMVTEFMISFTIYPECIYEGPIHWVIYSLLPAGFIVFIPLQIMQFFSLPSLVMLIGIDLGYVLISYCFFRWGLRRYESGNLIGTRI